MRHKKKYYKEFKKNTKSKTFTVGVIILCAVLLAVPLWMKRQQENRRQVHMSTLKQQAAPYEREIQALQSELNRRKNAISANTDTSGAIPCFKISSAEDVATVKELCAGYAFTPTILLDCSLEQESLNSIIEASAAENYDFVLCVRTMQEDTLDTMAQLQETIAQYNPAWKPAVLLHSQEDTKENQALLAEHGYRTLFRYNNELDDGAQDEMLYLAYGFIRATTDTSWLTDMLIDTRTSMAICFDLDGLQKNTLAEKDITDCLDVLDERLSAGVLEYRDVQTAFLVLAQKEGRTEQARAEFDQYAQQQEARIEELEGIVKEIYSHWEEY